jgi:hypothetical protein
LGWTDEVSLNATTPRAKCRFCAAPLTNTFVDLGMSPLCQTHIEPHELNHMERFYPLHAWVCASCYLVQLEEYVSPDQIFSDYAYFSSYSDSWVEHARQYAQKVSQRFALGPQSLVMEIASNDGYLLQHFKARGVPCRGIEPAANVAKVAVEEYRRLLRSSVARRHFASLLSMADRICCSATTCSLTSPTSTTLSPACRLCSRRAVRSRWSFRTSCG